MILKSYTPSPLAKLKGKEVLRAGTIECTLEEVLKVYRSSRPPTYTWLQGTNLVVYYGDYAFDEIHGTPEELAAVNAALTTKE